MFGLLIDHEYSDREGLYLCTLQKIELTHCCTT